jgi:hypothetical protein
MISKRQFQPFSLPRIHCQIFTLALANFLVIEFADSFLLSTGLEDLVDVKVGEGRRLEVVVGHQAENRVQRQEQ